MFDLNITQQNCQSVSIRNNPNQSAIYGLKLEKSGKTAPILLEGTETIGGGNSNLSVPIVPPFWRHGARC